MRAVILAVLLVCSTGAYPNNLSAATQIAGQSETAAVAAKPVGTTVLIARAYTSVPLSLTG